jgi:hypothetical protein
MEPFVTVQVYVEPAPPSGTETVAGAPGHRPVGAVIVTVWLPPSVIVTLAADGAQGGFVIVQARRTGPAPPVCVNVAFGVEADGENVPVPPLTTDQAPAPPEGVFPPRPVVVPRLQIVCGPPAVAAGCAATVTDTGDDGFETQAPFVPVTV